MEPKLLEDYRKLAPAISKVNRIADEMTKLGTKTDRKILFAIEDAIDAMSPLARRRRVVYKGRHNFLVTVDGKIEVNRSMSYSYREYETVGYLELFRILQSYGEYMLPVIKPEKYGAFEELIQLTGKVKLCSDFSVYISGFEKKVPVLKNNGVFQRVKVDHISISGSKTYHKVSYLYNGRGITISDMMLVENLMVFEALQDEIMRAYRKVWLEIPERAKRNEELAEQIGQLVVPYKVAKTLTEN